MSHQNQLATSAGRPVPLKGVGMIIPVASGSVEWKFYALPEVQDSKEAQYSDIPIIGRSSPISTYSHSGHRKLSITFHLHSITQELKNYHRDFIRAIGSLTHPVYEGTYRPPRIAWFKCGALIGVPSASTRTNGFVKIAVESYSYPMSPEYPWLDSNELMPQYVALNLSARVVYSYAQLPGANDVLGGKW